LPNRVVKNDCEQRSCIEFALKARPQRRYIPRARLQYRIWWLVTSRGFEYGIFALIMVNTLTLAMKVNCCCLLTYHTASFVHLTNILVCVYVCSVFYLSS